jgi:hypothetical protein
MRVSIYLAAASVLIASSTVSVAQPAAAPAPLAPIPAAAVAAAPAAFQLDETTWTFTDSKGTKEQESIDAKGNYIAQSTAGKHLDHGVSVMKNGKACFTSAMTKDGEVCWTTKPVSVGQAMDTVSDKGEKLTVTRTGYVALSMPK